MPKITIVGLGSGSEDALSIGVWKKLKASRQVWLRTEDHPVVRFLREEGIRFQTFDEFYTNMDSFADVYTAIAGKLRELAKSSGEEIVYAVPGHPFVAERTTRLLQETCPPEGIELAVMGGESFLDQVFARFGFDPIDGFQLLDGGAIDEAVLNPQLHTVIAQVYDRFTASDVKLGLMDVYPPDYPVVVGRALGVAGQEHIREIPLYELDRLEEYGNMTLVWVPRSDEPSARSFHRLRDIVRILRSPEGCPWDREQTHASLRKNLLEETYEVLETIDDDDPEAMCEELGDLLLQVMMHAQIEEEAGTFSIGDVIAGLNDKLVRRHPHVFGGRKAADAGEALANWQEMKRQEKSGSNESEEPASVLAGIPRELPGLLKAWKLQKKAAEVGFDWQRTEDVLAKVKEELGELNEQLAQTGTPAGREEELGDLLFAVVNLARFLNVDPERAIAAANRKFTQRFQYMEAQLRLQGKNFAQTDIDEMERYWQAAKAGQKN